jgi:hypothetical protein
MLLLLLILSISFGQLIRLELVPGVVIYLHDILVLLALIFYLPKVKSFSSPYTLPILSFVAIAALSLIFSFRPLNQIIIGSLYLWRWLAYALIYFVARQAKLPLRRYLILTGLIVAITGLFQYFLFPDTRWLYYLGWDEHYYRLIGTFFDPNFTGIFLVLTLILLWPSPLSLLPFIALLLTYSRSAYLALLVTLSLALFRRHKRILLISYLLFLISIFLLPRPGGEGVKLERLYSLTNRLDSMKTGWEVFRHHPITGVGFNLLRGMDNSFIFLLATTGLPGLIAYLWLLKRQLDATRYTLLAVLVHSLFNNTLFYAPVMLWLWLLLASDS